MKKIILLGILVLWPSQGEVLGAPTMGVPSDQNFDPQTYPMYPNEPLSEPDYEISSSSKVVINPVYPETAVQGYCQKARDLGLRRDCHSDKDSMGLLAGSKLSTSEKEDLAFNAVQFLSEYKTEAVGTAVAFTTFTAIATFGIHMDMRDVQRLMQTGQSAFSHRFNVERLAAWSIKRTKYFRLSFGGAAVSSLLYVLIPTDANADDTMEAHFVKRVNERIPELSHMSDEALRDEIAADPYLRDALVINLLIAKANEDEEFRQYLKDNFT